MKNYINNLYHRLGFIFFLLLLIFFRPLGIIFAADKGLGCDTNNSFGLIAEFLCKLNPDDKKANSVTVGNKFNSIVSALIGLLTIFAGLWFLIQIIVAGYSWIGSGGDGKKVTEARDKITNSLIGLIIIVIAWVLVGLVGELLGLNILDPGAALNSLLITP